MNKIFLIAQNTVAKEWRSKALILLFIVTVIMLALATSFLSLFHDKINDMSMQAMAAKTVGVFFIIINWWSYLISTYFGVEVLKSDLEENTMASMLAFPISRFEYLIGRISGAWFIVMSYYFISLLLAIFGVSLITDEFIFGPNLILGLFVNAIPNLVVIVMGLIFAMNLGKVQSFILVLLSSFFMTIASTVFSNVEFANWFKELTVLKSIGLFVHLFTPHISYWSEMANNLILETPVLENIPMEAAHLVVTFCLLCLVGLWRFKKKEL